MGEALDCLVIGGGPAGLTAAVYLGRFLRSVMVIDKGWSRAEWIPQSHNLPGFPDTVAGSVLLERMRAQAQLYGAVLTSGEVERLDLGVDGLFVAQGSWTPPPGLRKAADQGSGDTVSARTVLLATGVIENKPPVPHMADAVKRGLIRTCPICDGFESRGKHVGVLGLGEHAAAEALFLRTYTDKLSLLLVGATDALSETTRAKLAAQNIAVNHVGPGAVRLEQDGATALTAEDGQVHHLDIIYSAFGTTPQTSLVERLGARMDDDGRLRVDSHQESSIEGLFAAGDVVRGLNQISVANGEASIAATAIHNRLAQKPYRGSTE
jgi:thioredoxin reductase (NADPH)